MMMRPCWPATRTITNDLLQNGAPVDSRQPGGETPLHHAAVKENTDIVKAFLLQGADEDALDSRSRRRPWEFGCHTSSYQLSWLVARTSIFDAQQPKYTLVHLATQKGHAAILRAVIEHGGDVNATGVYQDIFSP